MKLGVYSRSDRSGPLILVALCSRPSIDAEHRHGPLYFQGEVESSDLERGIKAVLLAAILDASYVVLDGTDAETIIAVMDIGTEPSYEF